MTTRDLEAENARLTKAIRDTLWECPQIAVLGIDFQDREHNRTMAIECIANAAIAALSPPSASAQSATRDLEAENAIPREAVKAAQAVMREYQRYPVPTITTAEDALKAALPYLRAALSASGEQDDRWKRLIELANAVLREHDPDHLGNNAIELADLAKAIAEDAALSPPSASEQSEDAS
jgi:hypothetical protein